MEMGLVCESTQSVEMEGSSRVPQCYLLKCFPLGTRALINCNHLSFFFFLVPFLQVQPESELSTWLEKFFSPSLSTSWNQITAMVPQTCIFTGSSQQSN